MRETKWLITVVPLKEIPSKFTLSQSLRRVVFLEDPTPKLYIPGSNVRIINIIPFYSGSSARVEPMQSVRVLRGSRVRLECRASARPPPRITWYKDGKPVADIALRRFRVQNYR